MNKGFEQGGNGSLDTVKSPGVEMQLEAFAANAQEIKDAIRPAKNVDDILTVVKAAMNSAPVIDMFGHDQRMSSLSENVDSAAAIVEYDTLLRALGEIRLEEKKVLEAEGEYRYVDVNLEDYKSEVPAYILDRIAELPRFHRPE